MKQKWMQGGALVLVTVLLAVFLLPAKAFAAEDTPQLVLSAREGVVRVVALFEEGAGSGTGFAVGTGRDIYIVTNEHVVMGSQRIFVYYDTGKFVTASVYKEDISRDISILQLDEPIPGLKILPLETGEIDNGMGVYALGFPGASDTLSMGFSPARPRSEQEFLNSVVADTRSMTVTNGIISAIRYSSLIGDSSKQVKLIQTNTAINRGNSGGPLINRRGHVVGINTIGITGFEWHIEAMNGSVHISELFTVLEDAGIRYTTAEASRQENLAGARYYSWWQVVLASAFLLLLVMIAIGAALFRFRKTGGIKGGTTLAEFERNGKAMDQSKSAYLTAAFIRYLLELYRPGRIGPVLTPENIAIGEDEIMIVHKKGKVLSPVKLEVYPGYSSPESYKNKDTAASEVYYIGAMLYLLRTGERPPDAWERIDQQRALFSGTQNQVEQLINKATELEPGARQRDVRQLLEELDALL